MLMKREAAITTPAAAYSRLMTLAKDMSARVTKSSGTTITVEQAFAKLCERPENRELFALACAPGSAPAPAAAAAPSTSVPPAYRKLMKMAKRAAGTDPSMTVEQHFERLATAPENRELFAKAKILTIDISEPGDDAVDEPDDGDAVDDDEARDAGGYPDLEPGADDPNDTPNVGRSPAPHGANGRNLLQDGKPAVTGAVEGSYDPRRRPASALRKVDCAAERASLSGKAAGRYEEFLKRSPRGTHNDALWYARATKEQRQAYRAARGAAA
jgi:hypothetical protein